MLRLQVKVNNIVLRFLIIVYLENMMFQLQQWLNVQKVKEMIYRSCIEDWVCHMEERALQLGL